MNPANFIFDFVNLFIYCNMNSSLEYILTQVPASFGGKENWLGFKATPHTPMRFINEVTAEGVKTNEGFYTWEQVDIKTIQTIYQRLKLHEMLQRK